MGKLKLGNTVGGLKTSPTRRAKFDTMWLDLMNPSPSSQVFRERAKKYKGATTPQDLISNMENERDKDDKIRKDLIELIYDLCVYDWGGWDEDGKACPLFDEDGNEVECNLENFTEVIREVEGGEDLMYALMQIFQNTAWFKIKQSEEEKNFLSVSAPSSAAAPSRRTRKSRARQAA